MKIDKTTPPTHVTYNPVLSKTWTVSDPSRGYVYVRKDLAHVISLRPKISGALNYAFETKAQMPFVIDETLLDTIDREEVLTVFCDGLYDESKFRFDIILQSRIYRRQEQGQREFSQLCHSVGILEINDASELKGKEAVLRRGERGELFFTPNNLVFESK